MGKNKNECLTVSMATVVYKTNRTSKQGRASIVKLESVSFDHRETMNTIRKAEVLARNDTRNVKYVSRAGYET
jgi:hypothetical protein